jgi:hypothetical protein
VGRDGPDRHRLRERGRQRRRGLGRNEDVVSARDKVVLTVALLGAAIAILTIMACSGVFV